MENNTTQPATVPEQKQRPRRGSSTFGLLVLILGIVLLLQNFFPQFDIRFYGPLALIIVGSAMVMRSRGE